jgi:hypothetical protein
VANAEPPSMRAGSSVNLHIFSKYEYTPTTLLPGGIDETHAHLIKLDGVQFC